MGNKKKQLQRTHVRRSTPPMSDSYIEQRDNVNTPFFILRYVRGEINKETFISVYCLRYFTKLLFFFVILFLLQFIIDLKQIL